MKKLLKVVYILTLLFWGSFLAYGVAKFFAYNGLLEYYSFKCKEADSLRIEEMPTYYRIAYSYSVGDDYYSEIEEVSKEVFRPQQTETLFICYNDTYPNLSYIKEANLSLVQAKSSIFISLIFMAIMTVVYLFARKDYWIGKYQEFFKKL